jgi:hypothetical protein
MKYSQWIGVLASLVLVASCFFPWTYYPDLQKSFTGFFSEANVYGKPGNVFIFFCVFAITFFIIPRLWAKRWNFLFSALILAYAIKSFILFSGCYTGICPIKQPAIWLMLGCSIVILVMAVLPDIKAADEEQNN